MRRWCRNQEVGKWKGKSERFALPSQSVITGKGERLEALGTGQRALFQAPGMLFLERKRGIFHKRKTICTLSYVYNSR